LRGLGISFAQYRILELLTRSQDPHLAHLARNLQVTRQATQLTVGKLAAAGLVDLEREAHAVYVGLSELGRRRLKLFRNATAMVLEPFEERFAHGRRYRMVLLLRDAELALDTPNSRPWWLND